MNKKLTNMHVKTGLLTLSLLFSQAVLAHETSVQPELRCKVTYASTTVSLQTHIVADRIPYRKPTSKAVSALKP
jgi:hypothetical protein